jgi:hypothetical protein
MAGGAMAKAITKIEAGFTTLKRLLRNRARRYAARCNFPLDQGLAPLANYEAAASRLIRWLLQGFSPPSRWRGQFRNSL